jgi:hypothetical protein
MTAALLPTPGISSTSSTSTAATRTALAPGLKVELEKLRKEFAACVDCSSAKTEAGKRNIQRLDTQIKAIESRLGVGASSPAAASTAATSAPARPGSIDTYA